MIQIKDQFLVERLPVIDSDSLRVGLALLLLPPRASKISAHYLAHRAGVPVSRIPDILATMTQHGLISGGTRDGEMIRYTLTPNIDDTSRTFRLQPSDALEAEVEQLTRDKSDLVARLRRHDDESGLADSIPSAEDASVVRIAEQLMARPLTIAEAYLIGQLIQGYGPYRTNEVLLINTKATNPLLATAAMLRRGARGKPQERKPAPAPVAYFTPGDDFTPW